MNARSQSTVVLGPGRDESVTLGIRKLRQLGLRRLTRAHLEVRSNPEFLSKVSALSAAVGQALGEQLGRRVQLEGRLLESSVNPFGSLARTSAFALIELGAFSDRAIVEVDLPLLASLLGSLSAGTGRLGAPGRLTRIEESAFAYLVLVALDAGTDKDLLHDRLGARLLSIHAERGEVLERTDCQRRFVGVELQVRLDGGLAGRTRLWLPSPVLQAIVGPPTAPLPDAPLGLFATFEVPVSAVLKSPALTLVELCGLRTGDVVVLSSGREAGVVTGEGRLCASTFHLIGHFGPKGFFTVSGFETRTEPAEERMQNREGEGTWPQTSGLPVELEVELARTALPISQLALLRCGSWVADRAL